MPRFTSAGNVDEENHYAQEVKAQTEKSTQGNSWRLPEGQYMDSEGNRYTDWLNRHPNAVPKYDRRPNRISDKPPKIQRY